MSVRILYNARYVDAQHVATMIRAIPKACVASKPFIECVTTYNEAAGLCAKFAEVMKEDELRDPDVFLKRVEELYDYPTE